MKLGYVVLSACTALAVAGCGGSDEPTAAPSGGSSPASTNDLGKTYRIAKTNGGAEIGTIRFTDIATLPVDCISKTYSNGRPALGVRVELVNTGTLELELPTDGLIQVNDAGGFTQDADTENLEPKCEGQYPELARPKAPGKAAGWVFIQSQVTDPSALVFTPVVWPEGQTLEDFKPPVPVTPNQIVVALPAVPALATVAPTSEPSAPTTEAPEPTTPAAAPTTTASAAPKAGGVCTPGSDSWAKDTSGQQLYCTYAGGPTPKWVESLPLIGTRPIGGPCELGEYVAESPDGRPMVCVGEEGAGTWLPGP